MSPVLTTKWGIVNGAQVCQEITLAADKGGRLDSVTIRRMTTVTAIEAQRPPTPNGTLTAWQQNHAAVLAGMNRSLRVAEAAALYASALSVGQHPTAAVAAGLNISRSAAAKRVARARALGLLPATTRGKVKI